MLADPERYVGATLADPLEGVDYGTGKAKFMRRADGTPWIHSFAHGRTVYELKLAAETVRADPCQQADPRMWCQCSSVWPLDAELNAAEMEQMRDKVAEKTGHR